MANFKSKKQKALDYAVDRTAREFRSAKAGTPRNAKGKVFAGAVAKGGETINWNAFGDGRLGSARGRNAQGSGKLKPVKARKPSEYGEVALTWEELKRALERAKTRTVKHVKRVKL